MNQVTKSDSELSACFDAEMTIDTRLSQAAAVAHLLSHSRPEEFPTDDVVKCAGWLLADLIEEANGLVEAYGIRHEKRNPKDVEIVCPDSGMPPVRVTREAAEFAERVDAMPEGARAAILKKLEELSKDGGGITVPA